MKKIFYLASIAALAFSSCAKDETTEAQIGAVNGGSKITAAVVADDTRTHLEKVDGAYEIRWSAGDQLGVYAVNGLLKNAAFTLANDSDGKAVGVFTSQNEVLDPTKEYLAVYPRHQVSLFDGVDKAVHADLNNPNNADGVKLIDYTDVTVNIPETQYYRNGSFYTGTVPSVSTNFVVSEDGSQLSMQPVVDYLMVNFTSTEKIEKIELTLRERTASGTTNYDIAGKGALSTYNVYGEKVFRHYLAADQAGMTDKITLEVNENSSNVKCHEANTYVFVVPGGILGMNKNVEAIFEVYSDNTTHKTYIVADPAKHSDYDGISSVSDVVTNAQLNYYLANPNKAVSTTNPRLARVYTEYGVTKTDANGDVIPVANLENQVFWANPMIDTNYDGKVDSRSSFIYNPAGDVIIDNQWELLEYITKYNAGTDAKFAGKDAFLCEDGAFDFSLEAMKIAATEAPSQAYQDLIDDYLAEGFPCFTTYSNNFVGNGAEISNIFMPLLSENGIFGNVASGKTISGVEFANIVAKSWPVDSNGDGVADTVAYGNILANDFAGKTKDVVVANCLGSAVMGKANVAAFNGITFNGVSNLNNIFGELTADAGIEFKEKWAAVNGVAKSIFGKITPAENGVAAGADLNVIKIAEGGSAEYAKLTSNVDITNEHAVAVVIGGVSYWTGDKFPVAANDVMGNSYGNYKAYSKVQYAEQLANGGTSAYVVGNMDMNWANLKAVNPWTGATVWASSKAWTAPTWANIYGSELPIKNIQMYMNDGEGSQDYIAPFDVTAKAEKVTLDGVAIDIITDGEAVVPQYIAGFSKNTPVVDKVVVNGLKINARREDGYNTQANYGEYNIFVGWLVAQANDLKLTNSTVNGVESNIKGISGLVGRVNVTSQLTSSHIKNSSASSVNFTMAAADAPKAIEKFAYYSSSTAGYNVTGTAVGFVDNKASGNNATIKLEGVGQPKFLFRNAADTDGLNVIYTGESIYDTLHNKDKF